MSPYVLLVFPFVPPSANAIYVGGRARRFLSSKGRAFKTEVRAQSVEQLVTQDLSWINLETRIHVSYEFTFLAQELFSKGWPKEAKNPHKKLDVSNRIKAMEDAIFAALGVDDSQVFSFSATKIAGPTHRTAIRIQPC